MDGDSFHGNPARVLPSSHFVEQTNMRTPTHDMDSVYSNSRDLVNDMDMHQCEDKPVWGEFEEEPASTPREPNYGQYPDYHEGYLESCYRESAVPQSYPQPVYPSVHVTPLTPRQRASQHHSAARSFPTESSGHLRHIVHNCSENGRHYGYIDHFPQDDFHSRASSFGSTRYPHTSSLPFDKKEEYEIQCTREVYNRNYRSYPHGNPFNHPSDLELQRHPSLPPPSYSYPSSISRLTNHSPQYIQHIPPQRQRIVGGEGYFPPPPPYSDHFTPTTATISTSTTAIPSPFPPPPPTTTTHINNTYATPTSLLGFSSSPSPSSSLSQPSSTRSMSINTNSNTTVSTTNIDVDVDANTNSEPNMNTATMRIDATKMDEIVSSPPPPVIADLPRKETRREKKLRRKQMAIKTKLCRNYSKGFCQFGNNCHFAHGQEELRPNY